MAHLTRLFSTLGLAVTLVWPAAASAQSPPLPALTAPVNDFAKVIDDASAAELDRIIRVLHAASGDVLVVATVDTVKSHSSIEEYAVRLFEQAGVGSRESDNGALVLVAVKDRKVRIEVGYGLEEFVTDGFAGDTIRTHLLPAFREGRYGQGLVAATSVLATRIAEGRGVSLADVQVPQPRRARGEGPSVVIPVFIIVMVVAAIFIFFVVAIRSGMAGGRTSGRRRKRSTWSGWHGGIGGFGGGFGSGGFRGGGFGGFGGGGRSGGGFGGFGGGRSGGGGASGGW